MPSAGVAVIKLKYKGTGILGNLNKLKRKKIGVLYFPDMYRMRLETAIRESSTLGKFKIIPAPGLHTKVLSQEVNNLDGLICEETRYEELDSEQYPIYVYGKSRRKVEKAVKKVIEYLS